MNIVNNKQLQEKLKEFFSSKEETNTVVITAAPDSGVEKTISQTATLCSDGSNGYKLYEIWPASPIMEDKVYPYTMGLEEYIESDQLLSLKRLMGERFLIILAYTSNFNDPEYLDDRLKITKYKSFNYVPDKEEWIEYLVSENYDPVVIDFAKRCDDKMLATHIFKVDSVIKKILHPITPEKIEQNELLKQLKEEGFLEEFEGPDPYTEEWCEDNVRHIQACITNSDFSINTALSKSFFEFLLTSEYRWMIVPTK